MSDEAVTRDVVTEADLDAVFDHIRDIARAKTRSPEEVKGWREAVIKCAESLRESQLLIEREFCSEVSGDYGQLLDRFDMKVESERTRTQIQPVDDRENTDQSMRDRMYCSMPAGYKKRSADDDALVSKIEGALL